jgi:aspartate/methionine/tyrosine aminotransferase
MGQDIDPFRAITISKRAHELKEEGRSILHMEFGQPSTPAPKAAIARSHEVLDTDPMGYWESQPLKARICQHYKDMYGVDIAPGRLAITNGASPALVLALATAFSPGDCIAFARPGYVAYRNTVRALNFEGIEIPCGKTRATRSPPPLSMRWTRRRRASSSPAPPTRPARSSRRQSLPPSQMWQRPRASASYPTRSITG